MADSSDNAAAQDLGRREEDPDKARRNDDLLRDFKEKESLDARERNENKSAFASSKLTSIPTFLNGHRAQKGY